VAAKTYPLPKPAKQIGSPYTGSHGASAPNNWESRNAVDLATPVGTPVYAQAAGVIGDQIGLEQGASQTGRFAGERLHLVTGNNEFYYAHLSRIVVKAGEHVQDGQLLGYTGKANGVAHLHFAAKYGNPEEILGQAAAPGPTDSASAGSSSAPTAGAAGAAAPSQPPDPYATPVPVAGGVTQPEALDPGTVPADAANPRQYEQTWQRIAADPWAPPETQNYVTLWQQGG
jgi:murein DD-endopeptidase MepM/ murein hydrolase activator NlpD